MDLMRDPFDLLASLTSSGHGGSWTHCGSYMKVDLELAGIDPKVIHVSRLGHDTVIVRWTDRMGCAAHRRWTLEPFQDVHATFSNGLLSLKVDLRPKPPAPSEVPVRLIVIKPREE